MKRIKLIFAALCLAGSVYSQGNNYTQDYTKYQNLALTPPMGWNSWNKFACNVDESLIRQVADAMVVTGMKDAGYTYLNIDDCWHGDRDSLGFIHPDPQRFPSGMKALADYVHSKGLKLGIYSDAGSQTCGGRPGSRGYEFQDAQTYAGWGVDYLKYDWCNTDGLHGEGAYKTIAAALKKAGRPMVLSICEWGTDKPWAWGPVVGHLWRTTGDIFNCFDCIKDNGSWHANGVMKILDMQKGLRQYAGPGHWNDPDMLEVGNGMATNEDRAHFTMWCMIAAPLIAGNDLRSMSPQTAAILKNKDVIAIDQDSLGIQGYQYAVKDSLETWLKPLKGGDWAICFLNRGAKAKKINHNWKQEVITDSLSKAVLDPQQQTYTLRNLWTGKAAGSTSSPFKGEIPAHDVLIFRLHKKISTTTSTSARLFPANNPYIQYTGRIDFSNPKLPRFWAPGVYIKAKFKGNHCMFIIHDEVLYNTSHNYIEIIVDQQKPYRIQTKGKTDTITVFKGLDHGAHTITICKDTESGIGYLEFAGIFCDQLLPLPIKPKHTIEYIGDSITCGTGSDQSEIACGKGQWYDQHNAYMSYGPTSARLLNAQWHLTSVSGIGLMHSCCNLKKIMPQVFDKINLREDSISWNFNNYQPDVVTICLGQNDGVQDSIQFTTNYLHFIQIIRHHYPSATIICLTSPMGDATLTKALKKYLTAIVSRQQASGDQNISSYFFSRQFSHGCDFHPTLAEHQVMATEVAAYIKKLKNWAI